MTTGQPELKCDVCGAPAERVHAVPDGEHPERVVVACSRHDPGGETWSLGDPEDLASLLASPALSEFRSDLASALGSLPPSAWERSERTVQGSVAVSERPPSAFAIAASDPESPEYAMRAGYWCAGLTVVLPVLVLPSFAFGFLVARRGRLAAGIVLMVVASIALWFAAILILAITGNLGGSSSSG